MEFIAEKGLAPGDKLPSESELTAMFNVSRVTLRESLKQLAMMGVISIMRGSGTYVEKPTPANFLRPLLPMLALNGSDITDMYNFRMYMDRGACELAAQFRTEEDLAVMRSHIAAMERAITEWNYEAFSQHDKEFHSAIHRASKNELMSFVNDMFHQFLDGYFKAVNSRTDIINDSQRDHVLIFDAINRRRRELASVLMHEHLKKARDEYVNIIKLSGGGSRE